MNPPNNTPKPIQDVKPATDPKANLIEAELQHNVPIRHEGQEPTAPAQNPIAGPKQFVEESSGKADTELDGILKDVNKNVKEQDKNPTPKRKFHFFKKKQQQPQKAGAAPEIQPRNLAPILTALIAMAIACGLGVAAYFAFSKDRSTTSTNQQTSSSSKVGTSASSSDAVQAAGGTLVKPGDLTDLSNALQSKITSLSDSQDFNQADLSDQNLGL